MKRAVRASQAKIDSLIYERRVAFWLVHQSTADPTVTRPSLACFWLQILKINLVHPALEDLRAGANSKQSEMQTLYKVATKAQTKCKLYKMPASFGRRQTLSDAERLY